MREDILESCHGNIMAGHLSSRKSLQLLARQFYWWGMARDCDLFVKGCTECNRSKTANCHYETNQVTYHAGFPMERVHIDLLEPFPESQSGNKYVFMIFDQFTKCVECYLLPDQGANTVARALVDNFIARFGSPCIIHSDQGRQFESDLFAALYKKALAYKKYNFTIIILLFINMNIYLSTINVFSAVYYLSIFKLFHPCLISVLYNVHVL